MQSNVVKLLSWGFALLLVVGLPVLLLAKRKKSQDNNPDQRQIIRDSEFPYADWIYAQSAHETGGFKSNLFVNYNNAFGMGVPKKRRFLGKPGPNTSEGQRARYDSVKQSWEDLVEWMRYNKFPKDLRYVDEFVHTLKSMGYFTAPTEEYLRGVKFWLTKLI